MSLAFSRSIAWPGHAHGHSQVFDLIERALRPSAHAGHRAAEDPQVYDMICQADTMGVFQIESRAR